MENYTFAFADSIFDSRTGTLTRKNRHIHLPEQTSRLLAILLERANTLVTREELRSALWPDEEFIDYDQGINTAVNRLRNLIRDSARNPPLIRTIPKRGYSFHGEVKRISPHPVEPAPAVPAQKERPESPTALIPAQPVFPSSEAAIDWTTPNLVVVAPRRHLPRITWQAAMIGLATLAVAAWLVWHARSSNTMPRALRLGIAPLQVHGDARIGELGETFRLDITDAFSKLPGVEVHAASGFGEEKQSPLGFLGKSGGGESSRIDQLLVGTIVQQGSNYDLKFELVRVADAIHLASFEYTGAREELPSIRDRLQQDLFYFQQSRSTTIQTINGSTNDKRAYDFYLQGTYHLFDRNPDSLNQALADFRQAIGRDPSFASAYAGMATAYLKLSPFDKSAETANLLKAQDFARQALKIDPLLAQAHAVLGYSVFAHDWDFARGERELRYAIRIDPAQADYRDWLSILLVDQGRFEEGLQELATAQTNDPHWPSVYAMRGLMAGFARRNSEAIDASKKYVDLLPTLPLAHNTLAWVYFQAGRYQDAAKEWREMARLQNDKARVKLEDEGMKILRTKGIRAYSLLRLDAIQHHRGTAQGNDFVPAEWYACAGQPDQAIAELSRMAANHDKNILSAGVNPVFDSLHDDPRFVNLLNAAGLPLPNSVRDLNSHLCQAPN